MFTFFYLYFKLDCLYSHSLISTIVVVTITFELSKGGLRSLSLPLPAMLLPEGRLCCLPLLFEEEFLEKLPSLLQSLPKQQEFLVALLLITLHCPPEMTVRAVLPVTSSSLPLFRQQQQQTARRRSEQVLKGRKIANKAVIFRRNVSLSQQ